MFNSLSLRFSERGISFYCAILVLSVAALVLTGLVMIFSTSGVIALANSGSEGGADPYNEVLKQGMFALAGAIICAVVSRLPLGVFVGRAPLMLMWGCGMFLLVATALFGVGDDEWGARRWLLIGGVSLQVSEFIKIVVVLIAARLAYEAREGLIRFSEFALFGILGVLVPLGFILAPQSDLGTVLICCVGIMVIVWLADTPLKVCAGIIGLACSVVAVAIVTQPYRFSRFTTFLNPWNDGADGFGTGYQLIHSWYALANGGLFGVGLGNSHEKYLYLTQSETDFIFAIIGEEGGLIGALFVIGLFLAILWAGIGIIRSLSQPIARLVVAGCVSMIVFQAFMNIAMVIGLFPIVGKPLPFVSSGGSSLVAMLLMVGIILAMTKSDSDGTVYDNRRKNLRVVRASSPKTGGSSYRMARSTSGAAQRRGR